MEDTITIEDIKKAISKRKGLMLLTQEDCDILEEIIKRFVKQETDPLQAIIGKQEKKISDLKLEMMSCSGENNRLRQKIAPHKKY